MTNDLSRCDYYKQESQNVKPRYKCIPPPGYLEFLVTKGVTNPNVKYIPINEDDCKVRIDLYEFLNFGVLFVKKTPIICLAHLKMSQVFLKLTILVKFPLLNQSN